MRSEIVQDEFAYFDSGVMVMRVAAMHARRSDVVDVLERSLSGLNPWDDQGVLNNTLQGQWTACRTAGIGSLAWGQR